MYTVSSNVDFLLYLLCDIPVTLYVYIQTYTVSSPRPPQAFLKVNSRHAVLLHLNISVYIL